MQTNRQDIIGLIFDFNEQVIGTPVDQLLMPLTDKQHNWTQGFCLEELGELSEAHHKEDMVGVVDAVCDLIYGAMGTLKKMGLTREQVRAVFEAIHEANMTKKKGVVATRGSDEDAAKPANFVPPEEKIGIILFGDDTNEGI
jgi:phosphoribosyl-ATP pyrophosphohydrolase